MPSFGIFVRADNKNRTQELGKVIFIPIEANLTLEFLF
jgi:hypothetical protein